MTTGEIKHIDKIVTDLNGKADRDLSNLSETGEAKFLKVNMSNAEKPYVVSHTAVSGGV